MSENVFSSYPAISRSTHSYEEYNLPGFGNQTSSKCNVPNFVEYCPDCQHTDVHSYHCTRWDCPICYAWTAKKRARETATRLFGTYDAWRLHGTDVGYMNQIVISPPPSEYENFDEKTAKKKLHKFCKEIGLLGGAVVFHPFRLPDEVEDVLFQVMRRNDIPGGYWEGLHKNALVSGFLNGRLIESWRDCVEFSPHWHIVGFFKLKERSDSFYERTGWTYKNVSMEKYHEPLDFEGAKRTIAYLCTHHRIEKGRQSVTYFGKAAPNQVIHTTETEMKVKKCSECYKEYQDMDLEGKVTCIVTQGDLYRIPVRSSVESDQLLEDIRFRRFNFDPKNYQKAWYPVIHHFYKVRTEFQRNSKHAEIIDDTRIPDKWCGVPEATEAEKAWYSAYKASLPKIEDAPYWKRERGE